MTRHWSGAVVSVHHRRTTQYQCYSVGWRSGAMIITNVRTFWQLGAGIVPRANHRLPKFYHCISSKYPRSHWYQRFDGGVTVLLSVLVHRNHRWSHWWRWLDRCYTLGATERTNECCENISAISEKFHRIFSLQYLWDFLGCVLSVFYVSLR